MTPLGSGVARAHILGRGVRQLTKFPRFLRTPNVKTRDLQIVVLPSPKEGGGVGWGRVQQQQQKSAAAAASAAAARQGINEINTAMTLTRLLTCGIVVF